MNPRGGRRALVAIALLAAGLAAAAPFLTTRAVGTGEAYNYSLAVADAVLQFRAGEIPPLVGQTEYAFNGRIHPLRDAPYLFYLIGALDLVTCHQLNSWELQNLSLALSLMGAVFAMYAGLRWATRCPRPTACLLAAAYGLSPSLLASAYTANLFMTVYAAGFVPLALGAAVRQSRDYSGAADAVLGAALAAAWLAHPPVAIWLTGAAGLVRVLVLLRFLTRRGAAGLAGAAALAAILAGFVFVSARATAPDAHGFTIEPDFITGVAATLRSAVAAALLPVSRNADQLGDFQLGYAYACLFLLAIAGLAGLRIAPAGKIRGKRRAALLALVAAAGLLLCLTLPVPGLTRWLWSQVPVAAAVITNLWPMQRTYLVATGAILYAAALVLPSRLPGGRASRMAALAAAAVAAGWTAREALPYLIRGLYGLQWRSDATRRSHLSSNLDLTIISYAFLGTPSTFVYGVMDPQFEFRLLAGGLREIDSPLAAALRTAPVVARGALLVAPATEAPHVEIEPATLTLRPGRRYLLSFDFHTPPLKGRIYLSGRALSRAYSLPAAGGAHGFGMEAGNRRALSLWTDLPRPEKVTIRFAMADWPDRPAALTDFADFTLQAVDPDRLPVRLVSLLPLRCTVESPQAGCTLETPRRFIPGYAATVNGRSVTPRASPDGQVMVPVPRGPSVVELRYPGTPELRAAFWLSAAGWLGLALSPLVRILIRRPRVSRSAASMLAWTKRRRLPLLGAAGTIAAASLSWIVHLRYEDGIGPVQVVLSLPLHRTGLRDPVIATGRTGAGTVVFVDYTDATHVRVGVDVWGFGTETDPIPVDYLDPQTLVFTSSALYPLDHPRLAALSPFERERLRRDLRVEWNGRIVLDLPRSGYESRVSEIAFGENRIGSSMTDPRFRGQILAVERLPIPRRMVLATGQSLRLSLQFPKGKEETTEPLFAFKSLRGSGYGVVTYLEDRHLRLSCLSTGGDRIASAEVETSPDRTSELDLTPGQAPGSPPALVMRWRFDGHPVFGPANSPPSDLPVAFVLGVTPENVPGVAARFTGPTLTGEVVAGPVAQPAETFGPLRLVLTFPTDKPAAQEPLVVSGRPGAGDFIYVVYLDPKHVRFGFDHWGVSGGLSEPIAIDTGEPHELRIALGSLFPGPNDPAWDGVPTGARRRERSAMTVQLDRRTVFRGQFEAYPCPPDEVTIGQNRIGGSNCGPIFTGEIESARRLGLAAPPP